MRTTHSIKANVRTQKKEKLLTSRRPSWRAAAMLLSLFSFVGAAILHGATVEVQVGPNSPIFVPDKVTIQQGDTVTWTVVETGFTHDVTSGSNGKADGLFRSAAMTTGSFSYTFNDPGTYDYFCSFHYAMGMVGQVTVNPGSAPTPTPPASAAQFLNISTRLNVQTGDNVMIGGFIVTGSANKKVLVRGIGPSLAQSGIAGALADPFLELHGSGGSLLGSNDNWKDTQASDIQATTIPPSNDLESAIVATLPANNAAYTAIVKGTNNGTGVGLVEVYDLDRTVDSKLANISTRGLVQTGSSVMIGGFILGNRTGAAKVLVRGIGPSLAQAGVTGALADPTLELRDANGALVQSNDNWKETQQAEIQATNAAPANDAESAIVATLTPASYTAIVAGKNGATGVGLVELFNLQ